MSELNIKINIGGRIYPLAIEQSEEERVRKVVKKIKEDIEYLESNYSVKDKQDLLAMLVFQYGNTISEAESSVKITNSSVEYLEKISADIDAAITS